MTERRRDKERLTNLKRRSDDLGGYERKVIF